MVYFAVIFMPKIVATVRALSIEQVALPFSRSTMNLSPVPHKAANCFCVKFCDVLAVIMSAPKSLQDFIRTIFYKEKIIAAYRAVSFNEKSSFFSQNLPLG
jgi:hypothetical protein